MHRRRVGQIVGRYIHRLDGCDSSGVGIGDALLQPRQLRTHRWLITKARRHLAHQSRYFHAGLDETENVIDQQENVSMLVIAEILGHRQRHISHPEPAARRLIHLAVDHHHILKNASCFHGAVELFAFAAAFSDPAENAHSFLMPDHVVDHLREQHRLANTRAAE